MPPTGRLSDAMSPGPDGSNEPVPGYLFNKTRNEVIFDGFMEERWASVYLLRQTFLWILCHLFRSTDYFVEQVQPRVLPTRALRLPGPTLVELRLRAEESELLLV